MTDSSWLKSIGTVLLKTENIIMIVAIGILVYLLWLTNPSRTKSAAGRRPVYTVTEIGVAVALSVLLSIPENCIGITATTGEGLTQFGQGLGIQVFSVITVI